MKITPSLADASVLKSGNPDANEVGKWRWEANVEFDPNTKGVKLGNLEHVLFLIPNQGI